MTPTLTATPKPHPSPSIHGCGSQERDWGEHGAELLDQQAGLSAGENARRLEISAPLGRH